MHLNRYLPEWKRTGIAAETVNLAADQGQAGAQVNLARVGDPLKVRLSHQEEFKILIKPEFYKNCLKLEHKWQNFLKHADEDPDAEIEPFTTKLLALVIIYGDKELLSANATLDYRDENLFRLVRSRGTAVDKVRSPRM